MIGERVLRIEDPRLLTGAGRYTADIGMPDQAYVAFVRSPEAHAEVTSVDVTEAASADGVLAVLTGHDYESDGLRTLLTPSSLPDHLDPTQPSLTSDELFPPPPALPIVVKRVRHVGEIVALVVAETAAAAVDAAELVVVDFETLPSVSNARLALADDAPRVWESGNLCVEAERGDTAVVASTFEEAAHVVRLSIHNQRVHGSPIEPRSALATFDTDSGRYELYAPSQGVHRFQHALAKALCVETTAVRVVTPDVGGAFGLRIPCSNEYPLLLWAARRCGRPVKWEGTRSEGFLADVHGRDTYCDGALALGDDGRILALQLDYIGNIGAHPLSSAVLSNLLRMAGPPYHVPAMHVRVRGAFTNTAPTSVYRGAGRPQVTYIVERLMDLGATAVGLDRVEIRRRNLIGPAALPYRTRLGLTYDSGAFADNLQMALELIDWDNFETRRSNAEHRGKLAGIGVANYIESPGAAALRAHRCDGSARWNRPRGDRHPGVGARPRDQLRPGGSWHLGCGRWRRSPSSSATPTRRQGGSGSHADRSMRLGGTILVRACEDILAQGRLRAAEWLGHNAATITLCRWPIRGRRAVRSACSRWQPRRPWPQQLKSQHGYMLTPMVSPPVRSR